MKREPLRIREKVARCSFALFFDPFRVLRVKNSALALLLTLACLLPACAAEPKPLFSADFEQEAVDKLPANFMLIDGGFAVKQEGGNKFLELPGAPLDSYGVLFGPTESSNICIAARIFGASTGRRHPTFAVGLNGIGGYKIMVAPGKAKLELTKGETIAASVPYQWKSGAWTRLKLQIRKVKDGEYKVEAKVWTDGEAEPKDWSVAIDEKELPPPGRPSIWGSPYSGNPIRYDDIVFTALQN